MKKILALAMTLVLLASALAGCTTLEKDADGNYDRGAVISMYLAEEVYNFDPQVAVTDDSALKIMSLLFEGLTTLNSKGKWENAMMESYEIAENDRDGYSVVINLKKTKWTDGRPVQAIDYVYSWKRLLDPNTRGEAASLLFDVKNARLVSLGDISIDNLGVSAVDTYTLKVTFENEGVDLDRFFTNLSSLALVPLREDIISRYGDSWASVTSAITTNGPFALKQVDEGGVLRLERSSYYYRDTTKDEYLDKYVIPYRLLTDHSKGDAAAQLSTFDAEQIYYVGNLPLSERANYAKKAEIADLMSTHTYFFNVNNPIFADATVRRALSEAIDRQAIVEILTFAKAAEGVVPAGVFDTTYKTSFRKEVGNLIGSANLDSAKAAVKAAGVDGESFSITVRDNESDIAVAKYVAETWNKLGFDVEVEITGTRAAEIKDPATDTIVGYTIDEYEEAYESGDFDVIAVDMTAAAPDAFAILSQFSAKFSGNGVDMSSESYDVIGHVTGYQSDAYDELIEKAAAATGAEKADLLHQAEKLLVEDMPVMPLVTLQSAYVSSKLLKGFKTTYYGTVDFKQVKMKNYMDYKPAESEE